MGRHTLALLYCWIWSCSNIEILSHLQLTSKLNGAIEVWEHQASIYMLWGGGGHFTLQTYKLDGAW